MVFGSMQGAKPSSIDARPGLGAHEGGRHRVGASSRAIDDPLGRLNAGRSYRMRENGADVIARSIVD